MQRNWRMKWNEKNIKSTQRNIIKILQILSWNVQYKDYYQNTLELFCMQTNKTG